MPLTKRQCRIAANVAAPFPSPLLDFYSSQTAETVRGNATRFEFGFFRANGAAYDLSNVDSLSMRLMASQTVATILADKTLDLADLDLTLTAETWADGTKQHAVFEFSNAEMNIDPSGERRTVWLVVTAILDNGSELTLGGSKFFIHEDNNGAADPPPENPGTAITLEEADARYLTLSSGGTDSAVKFVENSLGGRELALWNETREVYQILRITGAVGSETLTFTDIV